MIRRAFASVVCLGLFALLAFACTETPERDPIALQRGLAYGQEAAPPIALGNDDVFARFGKGQFAAASNSCSDSIANCADPVKYLGMQNDCACFACGYRTAGQRTVCTKNPDDRKALLKRSK